MPQCSSLLPHRAVPSFRSEAPTAPTSNSGLPGLPRGDPMKRREFITLLGGAAAAWPVKTRAQPADQMRRIGVLMSLSADDPIGQREIKALQRGLQDLGW